MRTLPSRRTFSCLPLLVLAAAACSSAPRTGGEEGPVRPAGEDGAVTADIAQVYEQAGFIAEGGRVPFLGNVAYFAGATADSTVALVALSLSNRSLNFLRGGDQYQGAYAVTLDVRRDSATVRRIETREVVRVASFKETTRGDESVIFQQYLVLAPETYVLAVTVRDEQSGRTSTHETVMQVPALGMGAVSTPVAVYEVDPREALDSLPQLIANPRTTVVFGRDSSLQVYLESYGAPDSAVSAASSALRLAVVGESGTTWSDTIMLPMRGGLASGTVAIPISPLDIGLSRLVVTSAATGDSARAAVFVSFGENLAVVSFDEMLRYLRYFATPQRIRELQDAPAATRAATWAAFLRETDPVPGTPENEALRDYFARVELANDRFRGEGQSGWMSDRGRVFITLGEPDQVYEQGISDLSQRGRTMVWQYNQYRTQLVFVDRTGFGRWRLTTSSEADFEELVRRVRNR